MDNQPHSPSQLNNIQVFSQVSAEHLPLINQRINWHIFAKTQTILNYHEQSTDVYFIKKGSVRATTYSLSGKEISYQDLPQGDMFGELSALDHQGRITSIITLEASVIGSMSADNFVKTLNEYPSVNHKVMLRLTGLIRFLCGRIYEFSALDVKDRIRAEIIRMARENKTDSNTALIEKMPTHEEIANKISTHREAVTKEFGLLVKRNLIQKQGRKIYVPDVEKLSSEIVDDIV